MLKTSMDISNLRRDPNSPFTTPSDVLHALNQALNIETTATASKSASSSTESSRGRFELQTRLPNGTSRLATEAEQDALNLESKLQQVRHYLQDLSPTQQLDWAQEQLLYATENLQHDYKAAIDVYLTLLPVAYRHRWLLLEVMQKLAHASLQLQWYRKTIRFCTLGLEYSLKSNTSTTNSTAVEDAASTEDESEQETLSYDYPIGISKLYGQRAKAHRLSGDYQLAQQDLELARKWILRASSKRITAVDAESLATTDGLLQVLEEEGAMLQKAVAQGKQNQDITRRAMQQLFNSSSAVPSSAHDEQRLYSDKKDGPRRTHRSFSAPSLFDESSADDSEMKNSYLDMYKSMAARVAERLLILLGDGEWVRARHQAQKMD
jgi:hypothetical protein